MAVSSIGNTYLMNYSPEATDAVSDRVTQQIQNADTDEETLDACKQFEAYMIQQMFKSIQDNYLEAIAEQMVNSGQGLGIAEQLYESTMREQQGKI